MAIEFLFLHCSTFTCPEKALILEVKISSNFIKEFLLFI